MLAQPSSRVTIRPGPARQGGAARPVGAPAAMSRPADDPWAEGLPELLGERVRLRRLAERDAMAQIAIYGDPEVRRFGYAPKMDHEGDALAMIRQCAELVEARSIFHWGLATRDDDQAIGHMTLFHLDMEQGRAEV